MLSFLGEMDLLFLIFSDGTFIILKKNLGQILVEREALDQKQILINIICHSKRVSSNEKITPVESKKQKVELNFNDIAPAHNFTHSH